MQLDRTLEHSSPTAIARVLGITSGWFPEVAGGLENVFFNLMNHLPPAGVSMAGITPGSSGVRFTSGGSMHAFAPLSAPLLERLWFARQSILAAFRYNKPDLVASHFALYALPGLDFLAEKPLVVHFHGPWAEESAAEGAGGPAVWIKKTLEQMVYKQASRAIVLSQAFGDVLSDSYGFPRNRIRIVPGGVDIHRFGVPETRAAARALLGWPEQRPIILAVRRLVKRVGLTELLQAMVEVVHSVPDALLIIGGRGPEQAALENEIARLGLGGNVELAGFISDQNLPYAYRAADVTIVPSMGLEGFGLTTIESLASGTPVIVTPVGGLPEVVRPLSDNLVLETTQPEDIANGLIGVLTGERLMPDSHACRAYAASRFDWSIVAQKVRDIYLEAMG